MRKRPEHFTYSNKFVVPVALATDIALYFWDPDNDGLHFIKSVGFLAMTFIVLVILGENFLKRSKSRKKASKI